MAWEQPTVTQFEAFFARDFAFTQDNSQLDLLTPNDVTRAMTEALDNFPPGLFSTESVATNAFMYLTAFCLIRNVQMATKGIASQPKWLLSSVGVGGVSQGFSIPEQYMKDPFLASLTGNAYGQRYLELILPYLVGNVRVVPKHFF